MDEVYYDALLENVEFRRFNIFFMFLTSSNINKYKGVSMCQYMMSTC